MQSRDDENIPSSAPTESLPLCLRANAVPPGTSAHCSTVRAYLVLQRYVVYPKLQLMIRLRDVLILPSNSSSSTDHQRCPTGDLAPIPRNSCCPSKAECDNTNCSQVFFTVPRNRVECGRFGNIKSFFAAGSLHCWALHRRLDCSSPERPVLP